MDHVQLGDLVKDSVTGFQGVAVSQTQWLHGCLRIMVQPVGTNKEGKTYECQSFDEPQLKVLRRGFASSTPPLAAVPVFQKTGGPRPNAHVRPAPPRR